MKNRTYLVIWVLWIVCTITLSILSGVIVKRLDVEQHNKIVSSYEQQLQQQEQEIERLRGKLAQYNKLKYILYEDSNHLIGTVLEFDPFSIVYIVQSNQNEQGQYNVYGVQEGNLRVLDLRTGHMLEFDATQGTTVHIMEKSQPDTLWYYTCGTNSYSCTAQVKVARVLP